MFSSALKSFTSNISANYTIAATPSSLAGPWKIYDAKKKSTGKAVSVFIFDKKSLDTSSGAFGSRSSASSVRKAQEEVINRLKKEASSLARLRHPSILELAEPAEETRNGGLMFATEQVTASLSGLLQEKDDQERAGGVGGRSSRIVVEAREGGGRRRREVEIDELEIQKGLLQIGKGLEFLHESAGMVHANLTPDAIYINAKSDWKLSGLGFAGPPDGAETTTTPPILLAEVLNHDPRLPRSVQLNLDYTSPDFIFDSNITAAADLFSLGLVIIALYNSPHTSPLQTNGNPSTYKKLFNSSAQIPSQSNNFLSSRPLPKDLAATVLPRLITRRPAQRVSAREFQQSQYFDNILVSTIRFLDSLPAKTPHEKSQFMRGLPRILPEFPKSVLEKKVLPALLEEMKDRELLSLVLQNVFRIVNLMPSARRAFTDKVIPQLREIFLSSSSAKGQPERDAGKESGIMVLLENIKTIADNCSGKDFKDDILPILYLAIQSPTHSLVDSSLKALPTVLPVLDFPTLKNELFPIIATVFSKTSSLQIKVEGLNAFYVLCGGVSEAGEDPNGDGLTGVVSKEHRDSRKRGSAAALDKYTMQERIIPLLKGIKTKEPAVMMAALSVFKQVGQVADIDFIATEILPTLWTFSLGPLLNLSQFQAYISLIRALSNRIEEEQTRKLQELSSSNPMSSRIDDFGRGGSLSPVNGAGGTLGGGAGDADFASLVSGKKATVASMDDNFLGDNFNDGWGAADRSPAIRSQSLRQTPLRTTAAAATASPTFTWSTAPDPANQQQQRQQQASTMTTRNSRTITPDLTGFASLHPTSNNNAVATNTSASAFPVMNSMMNNTTNTNANNHWMSSATAHNNNNNNTAFPTTLPLRPSQPASSFSSMQPTFSSPPFQSQPQPQPQQPQRTSSALSAFSIAPPPPSTSTFTSSPSPGPSTMRYGAGIGAGMSAPVGTGGSSLSQLQLQQQTIAQRQGQGQGQPQAPSQGLDAYASLL
ncbi:MAG: hypothetical protein M1819_000076 [Sarea resinae]|nr:MAG: hypothetical protein M1819_000076 [Sarea resinae]